MPDHSPARRGRRGRLAILAVLLAGTVLLGVVGYAGLAMYRAQEHLVATRDELLAARSAIGEFDIKAATRSIAAAERDAHSAALAARNPGWRWIAGIPKVGDTPRAARELALAAEAATTAVADLGRASEAIGSKHLIDHGAVDLALVSMAGGAAAAAASALDTAAEHVAAMPTATAGDWVTQSVDSAGDQMGEQVAELRSVTAALEQAGALLPGLLGANGPRDYFLAVQAPNESRGTGGLVGTWAVVRADVGRVSVVRVGSNGDLPDLPRMPRWVADDYLARYSDDPTLFPNANVSPDFPVAARLWLESWRKQTGARLDGAIGIDVTAIGALLDAVGAKLTGPDGRRITGAEFPDFALSGIYKLFPDGADAAARKDYQEALAAQAIKAVLAAEDPVALVRALSAQVNERRVAVWSADAPTQRALAKSPLAHSLAPGAAHSVEPVLINVGWSKLDTYIGRQFQYRVGRCPDATGSVRSELRMRFKSDLPEGTLPSYVVGDVPVGRSGPLNKLVLQVHLPPGSEVLDVDVDGLSSQFWDFTEAGRPAVGYVLELEPRVEREVRVRFREPADGRPGRVLVQPLARGAKVTVTDRKC